jgi:hypothetical protein
VVTIKFELYYIPFSSRVSTRIWCYWRMRIFFLIAELAGRWDEGETDLLEIRYTGIYLGLRRTSVYRRVTHSSPMKRTERRVQLQLQSMRFLVVMVA